MSKEEMMTHNELVTELREGCTLQGLQEVVRIAQERIEELEQEDAEEVENLYAEAEEA
jgi:hypothetical protein